MPYDFKYPIDDNTLFILLALRYQGCIKRENIDCAYDNKSVNYDYTYLKHNNYREAVTSIREKGFDWITNEFGLVEADDKDGEPILQIKNKEKLEIFLYYYFLDFRIYKDYYYSIDEHKKSLVKFIETNFAGRKNEELGKKFTYKFTPDEQYKMIQYIGYLIYHNIFAEPIGEREMFTFNNGELGYAKAIRMRFADGYNIESFKRERKDRDIFYIFTDGDTNVYCKNNHKPLDIRKSLVAIMYKCIDENLTYITRQTYRDLQAAGKANKNDNLSEKRIKDYYDELNSALKNIADKIYFDGTSRKDKWILNF